MEIQCPAESLTVWTAGDDAYSAFAGGFDVGCFTQDGGKNLIICFAGVVIGFNQIVAERSFVAHERPSALPSS